METSIFTSMAILHKKGPEPASPEPPSKNVIEWIVLLTAVIKLIEEMLRLFH